MRIIVTGASGFIGKKLLENLTRDHEVIRLVRSAQTSAVSQGARTLLWDPSSGGEWQRAFDGVDAVIHLSGEPIAGRRWTSRQKKELISSRLVTTKAVVEAMEKAAQRPRVFLCASAIGFYGPQEARPVTEDDAAGKGFLADLCREWERQARKAETLGIRTVCLRTGIVLGQEGGALAKMLLPFRLGLGGPLGDGRQGMSWIHWADEIGAIRWILENPAVSGPVNLTSPEPVSMKEFSKTLGKVLHRPAALPAPAFALKLALGEMSEMLLKGQYVRPEKLLANGFRFRHPELEEALRDILA